MSAKGRAVAKAAKPKTAAAPKEPYNPASITVGNDYLDERDIETMQKAVDNPGDTAATEELSRTMLARAMTQPEVRSASIIQRFDDNLDINHLAKELRDQSAAVRKGDMSRADGLLRQAMRLDPRDYMASFFYARMLDETGRQAQAAQYYKDVLRYVPEDAEVHEAYARSLGKTGDTAGAYIHMAYSALYSNNKKQAERYFNQAKALSGKASLPYCGGNQTPALRQSGTT